MFNMLYRAQKHSCTLNISLLRSVLSDNEILISCYALNISHAVLDNICEQFRLMDVMKCYSVP